MATRKSKLQRTTENLVAVLTGEGIEGEHLEELCKRLVHASSYLQRMAVAECDRELRESERLMIDHVRSSAQIYAKSLGLPISFGGDPRGYSVKVTLPSGRSNHWGGGTWGLE